MLVVEDVSRVFPVRSREGLRMLFAVSKASFSLEKGECVGLVGESGCGKSTLGRLVCGLDAPTSGQVLFDGEPLPLACASSPAVGRIQMVFQDAFSSLDPRLSVGRTVAEGLGLPEQEPTTAPAQDVQPSPALSQLGRTWPVDGRQIGILVGSRVDGDSLAQVIREIDGAGILKIFFRIMRNLPLKIAECQIAYVRKSIHSVCFL